MQIPRHFTSLHLKILIWSDKGRRDLEMHCCCYGIILTRNKLQERASSSQFLLLSFRPKLVTLNSKEVGSGQCWVCCRPPFYNWWPLKEIFFTEKTIPFPPTSYFEKLAFICIPEWTGCAMQCVLRQGMGWDGLARERSQATRVEGSSHVALLEVKLLCRGCTEDWRHVWTQGVGYHLTSLLP